MGTKCKKFTHSNYGHIFLICSSSNKTVNGILLVNWLVSNSFKQFSILPSKGNNKQNGGNFNKSHTEKIKHEK